MKIKPIDYLKSLSSKKSNEDSIDSHLPQTYSPIKHLYGLFSDLLSGLLSSIFSSSQSSKSVDTDFSEMSDDQGYDVRRDQSRDGNISAPQINTFSAVLNVQDSIKHEINNISLPQILSVNDIIEDNSNKSDHSQVDAQNAAPSLSYILYFTSDETTVTSLQDASYKRALITEQECAKQVNQLSQEPGGIEPSKREILFIRELNKLPQEYHENFYQFFFKFLEDVGGYDRASSIIITNSSIAKFNKMLGIAVAQKANNLFENVKNYLGEEFTEALIQKFTDEFAHLENLSKVSPITIYILSPLSEKILGHTQRVYNLSTTIEENLLESINDQISTLTPPTDLLEEVLYHKNDSIIRYHAEEAFGQYFSLKANQIDLENLIRQKKAKTWELKAEKERQICKTAEIIKNLMSNGFISAKDAPFSEEYCINKWHFEVNESNLLKQSISEDSVGTINSAASDQIIAPYSKDSMSGGTLAQVNTNSLCIDSQESLWYIEDLE
ncbi:MAG: hypothetical protein SFT93_06135 [Rickettsiaceae bacterium]|nr:hypothetical protein [Rickettsiaceae bacterium]